VGLQQRPELSKPGRGRCKHGFTLSPTLSGPFAAPFAAPDLKLDQFLKYQGLVGTGGEAKLRIQRGDVQVNGSIETRRGRQLALGDAVTINGQEVLFMGERPADH
jgi:ribosome-associated protein